MSCTRQPPETLILVSLNEGMLRKDGGKAGPKSNGAARRPPVWLVLAGQQSAFLAVLGLDLTAM